MRLKKKAILQAASKQCRHRTVDRYDTKQIYEKQLLECLQRIHASHRFCY